MALTLLIVGIMQALTNHPAFSEALSEIERDFFQRGDALEPADEHDALELATRTASNDNEEDEWEWQIALARARTTTAV